MLSPEQRRLIERVQAHTKERKCSKDIQALLEMENYHQQPVSHLGSLVPPSLLLFFMCLFKQFRSAFPKAQPQPPVQVCLTRSPEPTTVELIQSLSINSKHQEETL